MARFDRISGALLPESHLYALDLDADHWPVHQYWLGSASRSLFPGEKPLPGGMTFEEVTPSWEFAKQMYWQVGGPWIWGDKRVYSDAQWQSYIGLPGFRQFKLYLADGCLAGYAETSLKSDTGLGELEYFGLLSNTVGMGAGPAFLSQVIGTLWASNPNRLRISTCTLDHPGAFRVYTRCGFSRVSSHSSSIPNAVKAGIITPQEIETRAGLLA